MNLKNLLRSIIIGQIFPVSLTHCLTYLFTNFTLKMSVIGIFQQARHLLSKYHETLCSQYLFAHFIFCQKKVSAWLHVFENPPIGRVQQKRAEMGEKCRAVFSISRVNRQLSDNVEMLRKKDAIYCNRPTSGRHKDMRAHREIALPIRMLKIAFNKSTYTYKYIY